VYYMFKAAIKITEMPVKRMLAEETSKDWDGV